MTVGISRNLADRTPVWVLSLSSVILEFPVVLVYVIAILPIMIMMENLSSKISSHVMHKKCSMY